MNKVKRRLIGSISLCFALLLITACQSVSVDNREYTNLQPGDVLSVEALNELDKPGVINNAQRAMKEGNLDTAQRVLEYAVAHRKWYDSGIFQNMGIIALQQQRNNDAVTLFQTAVIRNTVDENALTLLAVAYRRLGMYAESESVYSYGLIIAPEYSVFHLNIGILYDLYMQEPELAMYHYQIYQEQQPENAKLVSPWIADMKRRYVQ